MNILASLDKGDVFWVVYLICLIFGGWAGYSIGDKRYIGGGIVIFVLVGLIGWQVFGAPIK